MATFKNMEESVSRRLLQNTGKEYTISPVRWREPCNLDGYKLSEIRPKDTPGFSTAHLINASQNSSFPLPSVK